MNLYVCPVLDTVPRGVFCGAHVFTEFSDAVLEMTFGLSQYVPTQLSVAINYARPTACCSSTCTRRGVINGRYLVDPASSHMLVSKIKPCMCKYELIQTVKLRMAH